MQADILADKAVHQVDSFSLPTGWDIGPINLFLIFGEKLTLVDTGHRSWEQFNLALRQKGLTLNDIQQIVITHHHTDHVGLLERILAAHPVPVYGHPNAAPYLSREPSFLAWHREFLDTFYRQLGIPDDLLKAFWRKWEERKEAQEAVPLSGVLSEGEPIPGLEDWIAIETKGHAQSHIALYRKPDQVLISGDHIFQHTPSNAFLEPPIIPQTPRQPHLIQYREHLKKVGQLPVQIVLPGHGPAIDNLSALVEDRLQIIERQVEKVKRLLSRNQPKTAFQLMTELYPSMYRDHLPLAVSEVVGRLDVLIERQEVAEEIRQGIRYYRLLG